MTSKNFRVLSIGNSLRNYEEIVELLFNVNITPLVWKSLLDDLLRDEQT